MRAVAYARYSSDNQREESIDAQVRAIKEFCKKERIDLIKIYKDEAKTATTDDREDFLNMISDSSYKNFDAVIVHKLDRFARNRYDSALYKKKLKENGVKVVSVLEHLDDSPESVILESVLEGMAEYYSKNLSREVMKGMKETALQCKHTGGTPPLGYDVKADKTYAINQEESEAVKKIFDLYLSGYGYGSIADELNENGYKTKRNKPFAKNSIRDILLNEKYCGVYIFNRAAKKTNGKRNNHLSKESENIIRVDGGMPAIISKETYNKVMEKLNSCARGPRVANTVVYYILSGKVECAECNCAYTGAGYRGGRGGKKYYVYGCTNKKKHLCNNKDIRKDILESFVINKLKKEILNEESIIVISNDIYNSCLELTIKNKDEITRLQKKADTIKSKIDKAMDLILEGTINPSIINEKINSLNVEFNSCISRIKELQHRDTSWINKNKIEEFLIYSKQILDKGDDISKQKIINTFVSKVFISKNSIEVFFEIDFTTPQTESGKVGGGEGNRTPVRKPNS